MTKTHDEQNIKNLNNGRTSITAGSAQPCSSFPRDGVKGLAGQEPASYSQSSVCVFLQVILGGLRPEFGKQQQSKSQAIHRQAPPSHHTSPAGGLNSLDSGNG